MHNVLIVDDEPRHRQGMRKMLEKMDRGYHIIEARNGKVALEKLEQCKVDIMMTDIRMPVMDGLGLMENLGQGLKGMKVIILTAHGQFEYAKKAISMGASDYLLKPLDQNNFKQVIEKVEEEIKEEKKRLIVHEEMREKLDRTLPVYIDFLFNKWVKRAINQQEKEQISQLFNEKKKGYLILTELEDGNGSWRDHPDIKYECKQALNQWGSSLTFDCDTNPSRCMTVLLLQENRTRVRTEDFQVAFDLLRNRLDLPIKWSVSAWEKDVKGQIKTLYAQCQQGLKSSFYRGPMVTYEHCMEKNRPPLEQLHYDRLEASLQKCLVHHQRYELASLLTAFFSIIKEKQPARASLRKSLDSLHKNILVQMKDTFEMSKYQEYQDSLNVVLATATCTIMHKELTNWWLQIIGHHEHSLSIRDQEIMRKAIEEVADQCHLDYSLEEVAKKYYLSASCFNRRFKDMTGLTYTKYLVRARMERAKSLLEETDYKVYQIAEKVGYHDVKYFNRVFKNAMGQTPQQYRTSLVYRGQI